ncbi:MAG TPA: cell division protein ZapA [Candidatus Acidoferrales bacterium]|jgi:cell division protein ZapA
MPEPKSIRVEIYDQTYNLRGIEDEEYVRELAAYVDARMREISEATRTIDSLRLAVLAALHIADELHSQRGRPGETNEELRRRAVRCLELIDSALKQTA